MTYHPSPIILFLRFSAVYLNRIFAKITRYAYWLIIEHVRGFIVPVVQVDAADFASLAF